MALNLKDCKQDAVWIAHHLFERGEVTGNTANLSFRIDDKVYVSASGSSFGRLTENDFACIDLQTGTFAENESKPSKEWPLHLAVYKLRPETMAVLHTHSFFSSLWSCLDHEDKTDCMPAYTPYLRMKLGSIGMIPYAPPGSERLFELFRKSMEQSDGWLLSNHGPVVPGKTLLDALYALEELEESAHLAWELRRETEANKIK